MAVSADVPPPISCILLEHRSGAGVQIEVQLKSDAAQSGTYRLRVIKRGRSGSAQISQQSEFALEAGLALTIPGPNLSLEPTSAYRAVLSIQADGMTYGCERAGQNGSDEL